MANRAITKKISALPTYALDNNNGNLLYQEGGTNYQFPLSNIALLSNLGSSEGGLGASLVALEGRGTVQDALLKIYSPEMFGAVGDGVTDDTTALQSLFAAVASSGYCYVRLSGQYVYTQPLECHYIVSANYGVTFAGVTPKATFIWKGATGQNTLNLTMSIHGYRLVMRDIMFVNETGESNYDAFSAIRLAGEEHVIDNLAFRGKWKTCYWGVIQHLSSINNLNIQNDTRPASDSSVDPVGIGIRLNSCLNTTLNQSDVSYTNYAWYTDYYDSGQAIADILPSSYGSTVSYNCEGITFDKCGGTSNYNGVVLKGVEMKMVNCMIDICKYNHVGVYGQAIKIINCYFGIVSSYKYLSSRFYVVGGGAYDVTIEGNTFIGSTYTTDYTLKWLIPNTAHYLNICNNTLDKCYIGLQTTTGMNRVFGNIYDTNTSAVAVMAAATFNITDHVDMSTYQRYGGQMYYGTATDSLAQLHVQPQGSSSRRGFIVTGGGNRVLATCLGNATVNALSTTNDSVLLLGSLSNGRSLSALGTINASGADYAEYFYKSNTCGTVAAGDLVGIDQDGKITQKFSEAVSFLIKSTNPSCVGNDSWQSELTAAPEFMGDMDTIDIDDESTYTDEYRAHLAEFERWQTIYESARSRVDRLALCGQVPVNISGGSPGQYLVPVLGDNDTITGTYISDSEITFEQFKLSVGKVVSVVGDVVTLLV